MPQYNTLSSCVSSLGASVELLDDALASLDDATGDGARLRAVLATNRVFGLVPQADMESAKREVHAEIRPRVQAMVAEALRRMEEARREHANLAKKAALQQMRVRDVDVRVADGASGRGHDDAKRARLRLLQDKRERLARSLKAKNQRFSELGEK